MNHSEKTASGRDKYVKAMVASAIAAAGIGAVAKKIKERKASAEANNVSTSKNTIVVTVLKSRFMDGLKTPEELKKSRGEGELATDAGSPDQLTAQAQQAALTPEEIAAKKREIVGGRKFDFFSKRAEKASDGEKNDEKDDKDKGGRLLFRDQNGKFVSPSDPVAVEAVEKSAEGEGYDWVRGLYNTVFHPIDTAGVMFDAAKDKPVVMTAGAVGSIILAAKISDSINKMRRKRSKNRLDKARNQYVSLLEGGDSEKTAQDSNDPRVTAGALIGGAFVVPLALTALVTNRIIENRKNDKKREKEMSDSYPDEPIILYKTSDAKEMNASVGSMLATIAVYESVIKSAESNGTDVFIKVAQSVDGFQNLRDTFSGIYSNPENYDLVSDLIEDNQFNGGKRRNEILTNLADRYAMSGGLALPENGATPTFGGRYVAGKNGFDAVNPTVLGNLALFQAISNSPEYMEKFHNAVMLDPRTRDSTVRMFNSDNAKSKALKNRLVNKGIEDSWIGKTFYKGSALRSIFEWLAKTFGFAERGFNDRLNDYFNKYSQRSALNSTAQPPVSPVANAVNAKQPATSNDIQHNVNKVPQTPTAGKPVAPAPVVNTTVQSFKVPSMHDKKYLKTDGTFDTELWNRDFTDWKNQG